MRIAVAQILSGVDPAANLKLVEEAAARAAHQKARLVVFPEATMRAFGAGPLNDVAEPLDGPWASKVAKIARAQGVVIAAGMFTPAPDGRVHNTLLITGESGTNTAEYLHCGYHKIHLFDAFGFAESDTVEAGEQLVVVDIDGTQVGLSLCYDVRFPAQYRALAAAGATVIICAASWGAGPGKLEQWQLLTRARALDSTCALIAVGQALPGACGVDAGTGSAPTGVGHSAVIGADGVVLAEAGAGLDLLVVDLDGAEIEQVRRSNPVLANGRVTEESVR